MRMANRIAAGTRLSGKAKSILVLALPLVAFSQAGASFVNGTYEGTPSVTVSNDKLALTILVRGSTIADLVLADDSEKLSPYWNPVRMARELGRSVPPTSSAGHFVCVDGFGPVSAEERAAGLPGHGEAHIQTFEIHSDRHGQVAEVTMTARLPIVQEVFSRTFRLVDGENVVYVDSTLENLLGFDHPLQWAEHATVGSPFLEPGVTVFNLSGSKSRTRPYQQAVNPNTRTERRLEPGRDFLWPDAPGLNGTTIDMRSTPADTHYLDHTATLLDPSREYEWTTALNPGKHLLLGYVFRREDYPWLQTWGNYPPTRKLARGMEFSTQPYDVPRRQAVAIGTIFDTPTIHWLPAKATVRTRFLLFYTHLPDGFAEVGDVRLESGRLVIEDRKSGRQVVLAASQPL